MPGSSGNKLLSKSGDGYVRWAEAAGLRCPGLGRSVSNTGTVVFTGSIVSSAANSAPSAPCVGSCTLPTDTTTCPITTASAPATFTIYDTSAATGLGVMANRREHRDKSDWMTG